MSITISKTEYSENEEIIADVNISNIVSDSGIIAFGATIEYDKNSLTLKEIEGVNGWSNPSYNAENGKLVTERNAKTKSDETVLKIKFIVKEGSKKDISIAVKNVTVADGSAPVDINGANKDITIKGDNATQTPTVITTPTVNPTQVPTATPIVKKSPKATPSSTTATGRLPQTGSADMTMLLVVITSFSILSVVIYIKIRSINKKSNK